VSYSRHFVVVENLNGGHQERKTMYNTTREGHISIVIHESGKNIN
jgi:hypothetical protein